jgi:hypothetical protein
VGEELGMELATKEQDRTMDRLISSVFLNTVDLAPTINEFAMMSLELEYTLRASGMKNMSLLAVRSNLKLGRT